MPNGSQGIFLSYRRDDAGVSALLLRMCLEQALPDAPVFRDAESIQPGAPFRASIEAAISSSVVLLALIGPGWLTSVDTAGTSRLLDPDDVLVGEITLALRLRVHVIPVLVQGTSMPSAGELPEALRKLAELQAVSLDHRDQDTYWDRVRRMAKTIEQFRQQPAPAQPGPQLGSGDVVNPQPPIAAFAEQIREIRTGDRGHPPAPANTMAILRIFARERDVGDLIGLWPASEEHGGFAPLDAVAILTLAAVDRSPEQAAELAVGLRRTERGAPGLTRSIIHDLTAQRTVPDLAEFIAACKRRGQADLVAETLKAFVESASRVSLDKALLYFELNRFQCAEEASTLLGRTLDAEGERPRASQRPLAGVIGQVGMVGALRHLSPSQAIVENWIDERLQASVNWEKIAELVANLLGNEPNGDQVLARHVATKWDPPPLIKLCGVLAGPAHRSSPGLRLVRRYAAARDWAPLAGIIGQWYLSPALSGSFPGLLTDIMSSGADVPAPRPIGFFDNLAAALYQQPGVPPKCRSELLVAAASHPAGRPGADIAKLLGRVDRAGRRRAAQAVNGWFAQGLAAGEIETGLFTDYLTALRTLPDSTTLTFLAVRELTDPADPDTASRRPLTGTQIGRTAVGIYTAGLGDPGFDLLERYLENEQSVTATDAADLVAEVHACADMRDARWDALLGATIGRWADTSRLDEVRDEFIRRNLDREAAAVLSLFQ